MSSHSRSDSSVLSAKQSITELRGDPLAPASAPAAAQPFLSKLATAYSLKKNWHALFNPPAGRLSSLDGMRALCYCWVVLTHVALLRSFFLSRDQVINLYLTYEGHWWGRIINRGEYVLNTFFVMSGYLIANILIQDKEKHGRIRLKNFYIRRFMRLIPLYGAVLFLIAMAISRSPNAAQANIGSIWANLLYVNNFLPMTKQFAPWTWSLAVEEQFYILFPLLLIFVYKLRSHRHRVAIFAGLLVAAVVIRGTIAHVHDISLPHVNPAIDRSAAIKYFETMHSNLYTRFGDIVCGVIIAYLAKYTELPKLLRERRGLQVGGLSLALACIGLGFVIPSYNPSIHWSHLSSVLYFTCVENVIAIGVAFIMLLLVSRAPILSFIEKIFSWKIFSPISHLSYCGYLVHPVVIFAFYSKGNLFYEPISIKLFTSYLFVVAVSFVVSVILFLAVEKPLMNLRPR